MKLKRNIAITFLSILFAWIGMNLFHSINVSHTHETEKHVSCEDNGQQLAEEDHHEEVCNSSHLPLSLTHFDLIPLLSQPVIKTTEKAPIQSAFKRNFRKCKDRAPPVMM